MPQASVEQVREGAGRGGGGHPALHALLQEAAVEALLAAHAPHPPAAAAAAAQLPRRQPRRHRLQGLDAAAPPVPLRCKGGHCITDGSGRWCCMHRTAQPASQVSVGVALLTHLDDQRRPSRGSQVARNRNSFACKLERISSTYRNTSL